MIIKITELGEKSPRLRCFLHHSIQYTHIQHPLPSHETAHCVHPVYYAYKRWKDDPRVKLPPRSRTRRTSRKRRQIHWTRRGFVKQCTHPHSIAISQDVHTIIMPKIFELFGSKLIGPHQINRLSAQELLTPVLAAVCQHTHKYSEISAAAVQICLNIPGHRRSSGCRPYLRA